MAREVEEGSSKDSWSRCFTGETIVCPVCLATVRGDQDVVDAHVDSCLANESRRMEEVRTREFRHIQAMEEEFWEDGEEERGYPGHIGSVHGTFSILIKLNENDFFKILKVPDFTLATATSKMLRKILILMETTRPSSVKHSLQRGILFLLMRMSELLMKTLTLILKVMGFSKNNHDCENL